MIKITARDFSIEEVLEKIKSKNAGAIVSFLGTVRNSDLKGMRITCYKEMVKSELKNIEAEIFKKFKIENVCIIHRIGTLKPGDNIVFISVSAEHREDAFNACRYIIDKLKKSVPIWKEELR